MRHTMKRTMISLVLLASLLPPSVALAQGPAVPDSDWSVVKAVTPGSKLEIKLKTGQSVAGKLTAVSDTALSLATKGKPLEVNRDEIQSIHQTSRKSAKKATLIGLGVGAGTGAAIGAAGGDSGPNPFVSKSITAAGGAIMGAAAGAITGYLIGRGGRKRVLIYQAR